MKKYTSLLGKAFIHNLWGPFIFENWKHSRSSRYHYLCIDPCQKTWLSIRIPYLFRFSCIIFHAKQICA